MWFTIFARIFVCLFLLVVNYYLHFCRFITFIRFFLCVFFCVLLPAPRSFIFSLFLSVLIHFRLFASFIGLLRSLLCVSSVFPVSFSFPRFSFSFPKISYTIVRKYIVLAYLNSFRNKIAIRL